MHAGFGKDVGLVGGCRWRVLDLLVWPQVVPDMRVRVVVVVVVVVAVAKSRSEFVNVPPLEARSLVFGRH